MNLFKKTGLFSLLGALTLLVACSGSRFRTDFDYRAGIDFSTYKTFSWLDDQPFKVSGDQTIINPLLAYRIENAVLFELERKGYKFVKESRSADFVLSFTLGARDKLRVTHYPVAYQGVYSWGRRYHGFYGSAYGGIITHTDVDQYVEGTLAIDVFDTAMKEPVWHGKTSGALRNEKNQEAVLAQAVAEILVNFPPGSRSGQ